MKGMQKINSEFYVDKSKELGKGNFGVVYKGYNVTQNKIIAVKFMSNSMLAKNPDYQREIAVMEDLAKVNHPNIMGYYGYEKTKDGLYCFVEFCSGGSLKQLSKRKVSQLKALVLLKQLLDAMTYINKLNKVHRDLKPDNILLDQNLQLKIADFGLARDVEVLMTKGACTPLFAAPQVFNLQQYDKKCDVWSAGLILYEMLTGREMFAHVKTKNQLKEQLLKFKSKNRPLNYPKELHQYWSVLTQKMLTYQKNSRPSFEQLKKYFASIYQQMQKDLNKKYGQDAQNQGTIRNSKMRSQHINPYSSKQSQKKNKADPQQKLRQQRSYNKFLSAQKWLIFFRMKNDFMNKIIKAFTSNTYAVTKNVYKYILMFLSVSCYISKLSENLSQIKAQQIHTPSGLITRKDIQSMHIKEWQDLMSQFQKKHANNIDKFRNVLDKQIVAKITGTYLQRQQQQKIIKSYKHLLTWIQESSKGNFMKNKHYMEKYIQIINSNAVYCNMKQLKGLSEQDVKTYSYIRFTGYLDKFFPDKEYMNEDFIRIKRQQLENMTKTQVIEFLQKFE